ncbi:uncharacterized protein [Ptychodera flava]|uniref:uncharacterized protein n=1 Tax=Ptychodera flava TaxID=63121 RepID=UPI003969E12A
MQRTRLYTHILLLYCAVVMVTGCTRFNVGAKGEEFDPIYTKGLGTQDLPTAEEQTESDEKMPVNIDVLSQIWEDDDNYRQRRQIPQLQNANSQRGHLQIFRKTDSNSDGFITSDEYRENNPTMTEDDTRIVMEVYDKNGDKRVSQSEFLNEGNAGFFGQFEVSHSVGCDVMALHQCGVSFIKAVRLTNDNSEGVCLALQVYVDCVSRNLITHVCESESFTLAVLDVVTSFKAEHVCSSVDSAGLQTLINSELRLRQRREAALQHGQGDGSCGRAAIMSCDITFVHTLRQGGDPCKSLLSYKRCVNKGTRMCRDPISSTLRDGIKQVTRSYRKAGLCD